jgi:uncharacterized membrane-anchored protein YjiN (DUF445 family)
MIEIHALTALFGLETIIALLASVIALAYRAQRRKKREKQQAETWVRKFRSREGQRLESLAGELAAGGEGMDGELRQNTLAAVNQNERALYHAILEAFLRQDLSKLAELEVQVQNLSAPWQALLRQASSLPNLAMADMQAQNAALAAELAQARADQGQALAQARQEREAVQQQLGHAIATLDQVSAEYAKMFGERKTAEELQASRARMLLAFRAAEQAARSQPGGAEA